MAEQVHISFLLSRRQGVEGPLSLVPPQGPAPLPVGGQVSHRGLHADAASQPSQDTEPEPALVQATRQETRDHPQATGCEE